MSFIEKSKLNIKASALLYENQLYNASIHSAYYSCFQLILEYNNKNNYDYKEIKNSQSNNKSTGSHDVQINYFKRLLSKSFDSKMVKKILSNIYSLKYMRKLADYDKDILLNEKDSKKTIDLAEKTREEILKILNL